MVDSPVLAPQNPAGNAVSAGPKSKAADHDAPGKDGSFGSVISKIASRDQDQGNGSGQETGKADDVKADEAAAGAKSDGAQPNPGSASVAQALLRKGLNPLQFATGIAKGGDAEAQFLDVAAAAKHLGKLVSAANADRAKASEEAGGDDLQPEDGAATEPEAGLGSIIKLLKSDRKTPADAIVRPKADNASGKADHTGAAHAANHPSDAAILAQSLKQLAGSSAGAGQYGKDQDLAGGDDLDGKTNDTVFRFSRADNKGGKLDMQLTGGKADESLNAADKLAAKIEDITVLESRKFLGLGQQSNANMLAKSIGEQLGLSGGAGASLPDGPAANTSQALHTLKLQMHPNDLGSMTASLRLRGDQLSVDVMVETAEAYRHLSQDQDSLVKALRAQGFAVDHVSIQMAPSQSTGDSAGQNSAQSQNFEQGLRNGGDQGRGGRGPQDEAGRQSFNNQGFKHGNETTVDHPAIGIGESNQVYL